MKRFLSLFMCALFLLPVNTWAGFVVHKDIALLNNWAANECVHNNAQVSLQQKYASNAWYKHGKPFSEATKTLRPFDYSFEFSTDIEKLQARLPELFTTEPQQFFTSTALKLFTFQCHTPNKSGIESYIGEACVDILNEQIRLDPAVFLTGALAGQDGPDPRYLFRVALWHELAHIVFFCMQQMADATQSGRTQDMLTKEGRRISVPLGPLAVYANVLGHGRQLFLEFGIDIDKFPIAAQIALTNEMFADTVAIQLMVHNGVTLKDAIRSLIMLTYIPSGRATATDVTSDPHLQGQWRAIAAWLLGRRLADAGIEFFK